MRGRLPAWDAPRAGRLSTGQRAAALERHRVSPTVQTLAGIVPLAPYDTLIVDPALPDWLPELVFQNLRVGGATATLRFWRDARGRSKFQVLHKRGTLHVVRQPPPESLSADLWQRLHGVMESVA